MPLGIRSMYLLCSASVMKLQCTVCGNIEIRTDAAKCKYLSFLIFDFNLSTNAAVLSVKDLKDSETSLNRQK